MKKHLQDAISSPSFKASKLKRRMLLAALAAGSFCAMPAMAQLNYRPANSTNVAGTYTDLGSTGTIITVANNDNANSAAQPIGFTFNYNGQAFTQFVLNTNGYIKLGSTAPSSAALLDPISSTNSANTNIIAASSFVDLQGAADQTANPTEFRVATTGTAPNRVTTIQFENLADKATTVANATAQFTTMQFQIKLYETTNNIELVYGTWVSNSATTPGGQPLLVGLKGSTAAPIDWVLASKPSSGTAWTATTFVNQDPNFPGDPALHFVRNTFLPDAGRTYRFTPFTLPPNDLSVEAIFSQGKVATATGTPHVVKALIKNTGSAAATNKVISLDVTGNNTFSTTVTLASLPAGADTIISFASYMPVAGSGTNFIEVSVPNDDVNLNNAKDFTQVVSTNAESYAMQADATTDPVLETAIPGPFGQTAAANSGVRLSRFFATNKVKVNSMRAYIPGPAFNPAVLTATRTVYAIVVDASGNELARSADMVLTAADVDNFITFNFPTPAIVENQDYFIGLGLLAKPTAVDFSFPFSVQNGDADRPNTNFVMPTPGTTPVAPEDAEDDYRFLFEANLTNITGVKEDLNAKLVSVYPNPSNGVFNVSAKDMKGGNLNLEVRDMQGRLVYSAAASKDNATINLKNVASGVYMLKASTDAEVAVKRIVVQ
ncbi:T9SS type A sorting domain-containing protein [Adhaeribacter terrigena]|nr:T9SS type A sorting domain-containing protein [Adhaeribacter terrigena]